MKAGYRAELTLLSEKISQSMSPLELLYSQRYEEFEFVDDLPLVHPFKKIVFCYPL